MGEDYSRRTVLKKIETEASEVEEGWETQEKGG